MKIKLTLISIWYRGQRHSFFANVPVDTNGKARITGEELHALAEKAGVIDGTTYSVGA